MISHHGRRAGLYGRDASGERGSILTLVALTLVAVVFMVAIVIDLGYTRGGAGFDQSTADLAALAGGNNLARKKYVESCKDIITYVNTNAKGITAINASDFCAGFSSTVCSGGDLPQVTPTKVAGMYTVSIRFPVPASEIADRTFGAGKLDGAPCERMTVSITSSEPSFFGGIGGKNQYSVSRSATVRGGASQTRLVPALWLLDPVGCGVLSVQGGSKVYTGDVSDLSNIRPGVITLDSDASDSKCSTSNPVLSVGGTGTEVRSIPVTETAGKKGEITLRALPFGATSCTGSFACIQSAVGSQILPQPVPVGERATRAPVDWAWNCKASYPNYLGIPIKGCAASDTSGPYIDRLVSGVGGSGQPTGFQKWSTSYGCSPSGTITVAGNWWVDCAGGLSITNGTTITFAGGNVVFDGGIRLNSGGVLNVNTNNPVSTLPIGCLPPNTALPCLTASSSRASFVYVRGGDWNLGGGAFNGKSTMVYLSPTSFLKGTGGAPPSWTAPTDGPFGGLALWAEASGSFNVSGGAGVSLRGTFFTPYANALTLTGGGNWGQQNAQFISYRLVVSGGSNLTMAPDPTSAVLLPPAQATLIR